MPSPGPIDKVMSSVFAMVESGLTPAQALDVCIVAQQHAPLYAPHNRREELERSLFILEYEAEQGRYCYAYNQLPQPINDLRAQTHSLIAEKKAALAGEPAQNESYHDTGFLCSDELDYLMTLSNAAQQDSPKGAAQGKLQLEALLAKHPAICSDPQTRSQQRMEYWKQEAQRSIDYIYGQIGNLIMPPRIVDPDPLAYECMIRGDFNAARFCNELTASLRDGVVFSAEFKYNGQAIGVYEQESLKSYSAPCVAHSVEPPPSLYNNTAPGVAPARSVAKR